MKRKDIINKLLDGIKEYMNEPYYQEVLIETLYFYSLKKSEFNAGNKEINNGIDKVINELDNRFKDEYIDIKMELKQIQKDFTPGL